MLIYRRRRLRAATSKPCRGAMPWQPGPGTWKTTGSSREGTADRPPFSGGSLLQASPPVTTGCRQRRIGQIHLLHAAGSFPRAALTQQLLDSEGPGKWMSQSVVAISRAGRDRTFRNRRGRGAACTLLCMGQTIWGNSLSFTSDLTTHPSPPAHHLISASSLSVELS